MTSLLIPRRFLLRRYPGSVPGNPVTIRKGKKKEKKKEKIISQVPLSISPQANHSRGPQSLARTQLSLCSTLGRGRSGLEITSIPDPV